MPVFSSLSDLVKHFESSGGTDCSTSPTGAAGCYQIRAPTWRDWAPGAGVDLSQYPTADTAPQSVQDAVFANMVANRGLADYTCPRCNPPLTNYVNNNPYVASLPIFSDASATSTGAGGDTLTIDPNYSTTPSGPTFYVPGSDTPVDTSTYPAQAVPFSNPGSSVFCDWTGLCGPTGGQTGLPGPAGALPSTGGGAAGAGGPLGAIASWTWDKISRFGLIILGALLLVVAAWGMVRGENPAEAVRSLAKAGG